MCGIVGVFTPDKPAARDAFFALFALQHRGQESAGIASVFEKKLILHKAMGLVNQVFNEDSMARLQGEMVIGHNRYSTTGQSVLENAHPFVRRWPGGGVALAHNGNLVNAQELKDICAREHLHLYGTSDSEAMVAIMASDLIRGKTLEKAVEHIMQLARGAYSIVALVADGTLVAFRDPYGIQPLVLGRSNNGWVIASEDCSFGAVGATKVRDVTPGECLFLNREGGLVSRQILPSANAPALCIFQAIYFSRPDSHLFDRLIYESRRSMGKRLAQEYPAVADLVIPVPDSSFPGAHGYSQASGIPFAEGFVKSRYIHRTFISPDANSRSQLVRMKLSVMREQVAGKRLVLVDDSIVRGTTTGEIVRMLREAGATEVHVRITSPPVRHPCFYGMDMSTSDQQIAVRMDVSGICQHIGADSLCFLSLEGAVAAAGGGNRFCTACFSGKYPIKI